MVKANRWQAVMRVGLRREIRIPVVDRGQNDQPHTMERAIDRPRAFPVQLVIEDLHQPVKFLA